MSYDLTFLARTEGTIPSNDDLTEFFANHAYCSVSGHEALYENPDTGVYFSFRFGDPIPSEDGEEMLAPIRDKGLFWTGISFNINYFRPHVFGLEAAPEVKALVDRFDLAVDDPQNSGMGTGDYSIEGFLSGWNTGNAFAYSALKSQHGDTLTGEVLLAPTSTIEAIWRWNLGRRKLQESVPPEIYVTKIFTMKMDNALTTMAVWSDAIPTILPSVDYIGLYRDELAPRQLFRGRKPDTVFMPFNQVARDLDFVAYTEDPLKAYRIAAPGESEREYFRRARQPMPAFTGVHIESILNKELYENAEPSAP